MQTLKRVQVFPYSEELLDQLLSEGSNTPLLEVNEKAHTEYFRTYFGNLKAKSIIVERRYVDHDYREDYAGFYARCFQDYSRDCTRLHFFRKEINEESFLTLLSGQKSSITVYDLQEEKNYLGFIVVKPIPKTFVGKTCLTTYPSEDERNFPITREYQVNLFGIPLKIKTLAFQEQDFSVSACATSALWSAFQGTGKLFQHQIPSPVSITHQATSGQRNLSRAFPNEGLSLEHMANAIQSIGLAPLWVDFSELKDNQQQQLQASVYAYTKGRVPVLLVGEIIDATTNEIAGHHAVAVTGYRTSQLAPDPDRETGLLLEATRLSKLYAHDDQVGPFARMEFKSDPNKQWLTTSHSDSSGTQAAKIFKPICLLIPLSHSVRLPFGIVRDAVIAFDSTLESLRSFLASKFFPDRFTWDIYLTNINDLKTDVFGMTNLTPEHKLKVLQQPLPLFLWVARMRSCGNTVVDFLFDATDIQQGKLLVGHIEHDEPALNWLKSSAHDIENQLQQTQIAERSLWVYLSAISKG